MMDAQVQIRTRRQNAAMVGADHLGEREKDDFYPTPDEGTEALLAVEQFTGPVWEPACGDGAICRVLERHGHEVVATDLVCRGYGDARIDFLMEWKLLAPNVITNPPFKLGEAFIDHALNLGAAKLAILARLTFLETPARSALFKRTGLTRVWVFENRLAFHRSGIVSGKGANALAFAWFVWERGYQGLPTLGWLSRPSQAPT